MQTILDKIDLKNYVALHKKEILADLFSLARIPSVRSEAKEGAPFGEGCKAALEASLKLFKDAGFKGEISADNTYALAFYGGEEIEKSVGIFAHTDVVPAGDGWTLTEPFEPKLCDGYAVGRGVSDNKAGVVIALWLLKYLKEKNISLKRPITVFLGSSEEKEMVDIHSYRKDHPSPYVSLVPDSGYPVCYGEKGIARFWFDAKEAFDVSLTVEGGTAPNVVLGKVTAKLCGESIVPSETLNALLAKHPSVSAKFENGVLFLEATGVSAHASAPQSSVNAGWVLFSFLTEWDALSAHDRATLCRAKELLSVYDGSQADIAGSDGAFTPLTMTNGIISTEGGKLSLCFDVRYPTHITPEELEKKAKASAERNGCDLRMMSNREGFLNPIDSPAMIAILDTCEAYTGSRPKPFLMGGGTYARELTNAYSTATFVPYISDPFGPCGGRGGAHQADEHLPIDAFLETIALSAEMVAKLSDL